jgi:hypothetical protein
MKFSCQTFFDITATGVIGHYKSSRIPFDDKAGQAIESERSWNRSRNQQRNWETITQLLSMRTQIFDLTVPKKIKDIWNFEFEIETVGVFASQGNPVGILLIDANGVPMLTGLTEKQGISPTLVTTGKNQNIWFSELV